MLSAFVKNSAIYYLSTILTKGISFFLLPFYTSVFTTSDYGVLEMVSILSTLTIVLFTFQINEGVGRYYNELSSHEEIKIYTSSVTFFSLLSFGFFFLLSWLLVVPISQFVHLSKLETLIATGSISLNGIFYLAQNQLIWKLKPTHQMISSMVYNITTIGLTIALILFYDWGVEGVFMAQIVGAFIGILFVTFFNRFDLILKVSWKIIKKLLHFSFPLIPNALAIYAFMYVDRVFIQNMLGYDALGVYSFSFKIASILMIAHFGMSTALSPLIYKFYKDPETPQKIRTIFRIFTLISMVTMFGLTIFSFDLVSIMAGSDGYEDAPYYIPLLLLSIYIGSLSQFFPGLIISKRTKLISLISITMGLLNLILNYFLIDLYGIMGACISTAIAAFFNYLTYRHFANKNYEVPIEFKLFFAGIFLFGFVCFFVFVFELTIIFKIILFICGMVLLGLTYIKRTDLDNLKRILNQVVRSDG